MIKVNTNWAKSAKVSNQDYSWAHVALHTLSMGYDITMTLYNNNLLERIEMTPGYATDKMVQTIKDERLKHTISGDPNKDGNMVDVVVVELKRLGIKAEQNSIVEFQLDTRCQRLAEYYNKRIQRVWFYGVVDFDERYETHLINNGFDPLYSNGNVYFRSKKVYADKTKTMCVIQNAYILDFKALVDDACSRNETFLKVLQNNFKNN